MPVHPNHAGWEVGTEQLWAAATKLLEAAQELPDSHPMFDAIVDIMGSLVREAKSSRGNGARRIVV